MCQSYALLLTQTLLSMFQTCTGKPLRTGVFFVKLRITYTTDDILPDITVTRQSDKDMQPGNTPGKEADSLVKIDAIDLLTTIQDTLTEQKGEIFLLVRYEPL